MGYRSLRECVDDLSATGRLIHFEEPVQAELEAAEVQRRMFQAGGPAIYFSNVVGCRFPMVGNLFGTKERVQFLFRDTLDAVSQLVRIKADPSHSVKEWWKSLRSLPAAWHMRPRKVRRGPAAVRTTTIDQLPQLKSWPDDGGAFITLPQVYTEHPDYPGIGRSNLGMYRVQLSGNDYQANEEVGLHYQIHRGIGVHHAAAIRRGEKLRAHICVGGPPAMSVAAVMPLPEGLPELYFAGALGGRRVRMIYGEAPLPIPAEVDFCITGYIDPQRELPEGPFGDHLGYYSLRHDFPVLCVEKVYHREDAIWPFTTVGRPPQEDTMFGELIHEITGPMIPAVLPGVRAVHAVDASGVHPLLLAVGSERYVPYAAQREPQELLTQANAILGQGQMSLAKYLLIVADEDDPALNINDIAAFFGHLLTRIDWRRDLHFQTRTTIDTLDYSGSGLNRGSKVVIAAAGEPIRSLPTEVPGDLRLPAGFAEPRVCLPGILAVEGPPFQSHDQIEAFCDELTEQSAINAFPLVVVVENSEFAARSLSNFLWVTFTRSNPAADINGIGRYVEEKHWGCRGSLVIDARPKPHHAPPLIEDPEVSQKVDAWAASGGPLSGVL